MTQLPWLAPDLITFPETQTALDSPNGLLAAGGSLSPKWLLHAYSKGIFPWFSEGEPILWWSPSPRNLLYLNQLHISKSLSKTLRKNTYNISFDKAFKRVMEACAKPRPDQQDTGTWISTEMINAYYQLHQLGHAHSIEVWDDDELVGGIYGIALGRVFFGESMFSRRANTSKIALVHLVEQLKQWHYIAIDCQVYSDHLASLGATEVVRDEFETLLEQHVSNTHCHWNATSHRYIDPTGKINHE